VFASEIKAILSSGLIESEFNELAVDNYLANRYVREPYTFFKNIYQVKSATYLEVDSNLEIKENEYWRIPKLNFEKSYDETKIIEMLDEKITEAVSRRLISDVKLGTYLSGGVDSSLLTAIASNLTNKRIDTYTIGFNEEGFNEFKYSQMVADVYNTNHHIIEMEVDNYMNKWDELIWYKDSPLGVPNEIPLAIMSKELKKNITVVLSGEGADELFGGYGKIYRAAFEYKNIDTREDFYDFFINKYEYVPRNMRDEYLNIDTSMRDEFDEANVKEIFHKYQNEEAIFRFFYESHIKSLLQRLDMTTMQTAVEGRVPFLDYKLIEFVFENIPYDLKLKWNSPECYNLSTKMNASKFSEVMDTPKYILKKVSEKYLPSEVINRKKMGFPVPLNNWFDNIEKIAETELKDAYWINSNKLEKLILQVKNSEKAGQILWMFVNIELFRKKYFLKNWIY
jgi:asparagine synthase (glutamine-hydrolysing)